MLNLQRKMHNLVMMMLSSPSDRDKLLNGVKEISNSMTRVDAEKDYQRDAIAALSSELGIEKKYVSKVANIYHKQNFHQFQAEQTEIEDLYESITSSNNNP